MRRRARQLICRTPACDPSLHVVEQGRRTRIRLKASQAPAILRNIGTGDINDEIEKRNGFREARPRPPDRARQPFGADKRIGVGVDIQRAADDVHGERIVVKGRFVEMSGNLSLQLRRVSQGLLDRT